MKKFLLLAGSAILLCHAGALAQRQCGAEILKNALIAQNPAFAQKLEQQRASLQGIADSYRQTMQSGEAERATTEGILYSIPVIFHFIVDSAQLAEIGGTTGITERIDSQIAVLNRDYNRGNSDSTLILAGFKPYYASVGIHFGLAHTAPADTATPGYELKIIKTAGFSGDENSYMNAKDTATGGLHSWDVSKYLNIWCIGFTDLTTLLGITVPESFVGPQQGMEEANKGICVAYNAVGKRRLNSDSYPSGIDEGRTLTHECGHFFEIWHVWGDDGGLCPWNGGQDDGIADTPPQADATFGNPIVPDYDGCKMDDTVDEEPYGIMCMDYMDYTNDNAMHMFTKDQAAVMFSQISTGGESNSLTQNPGLLQYPTTSGVAQVGNENTFTVAPNPSTGVVNIIFNQSKNDLQKITVLNMLGQEVKVLNTTTQGNVAVDLTGMSKGVYLVKCSFASETITKKILLQ